MLEEITDYVSKSSSGKKFLLVTFTLAIFVNLSLIGTFGILVKLNPPDTISIQSGLALTNSPPAVTALKNRITAVTIMNVVLFLYVNYFFIKDIGRSYVKDELKVNFLSVISHELRTPLTSLLGLVFILRKRFEKGYFSEGAGGMKYLDDMQRQIKRMNKMILEMLIFSKFQSAIGTASKEYFDARRILLECVNETKALSGRHKIIIDCRGKTDIFADPFQLKQTLMNLLDNAVKYSPPGLIELKCQRAGSNMLFSVKDQGVGIDDKYKERIFEKFFQVEKYRRKDDPKLGLGLYIASNYVHSHGGKLWVESVKGMGSTFYFTIPQFNQLSILPEDSGKVQDIPCEYNIRV